MVLLSHAVSVDRNVLITLRTSKLLFPAMEEILGHTLVFIAHVMLVGIVLKRFSLCRDALSTFLNEKQKNTKMSKMSWCFSV